MTVEQIVIVSGLSGSGKSTAIEVLEDLEFFCVDNLPLSLLLKFIELGAFAKPDFRKVAFVMDARSKEEIGEITAFLSKLKKSELWNVQILFLESSDEVLLRRFSQTRRRHPLDQGDLLQNSIALEKQKLQPMRDLADRVIDTSHLTVHELKTIIREIFLGEGKSSALAVRVCSFGYRYGLPPEADLVMDVRFFPNPYFHGELKFKTGEDPEVEEFIFSREGGKDFFDFWTTFLNWLLPRYVTEGKSYLTLAFGCTGGRHRSVAIARYFHDWLKNQNYTVTLTHRDLHRPLL